MRTALASADVGSSFVSTVRGAADIAENGLSVGNAVQTGLGVTGLYLNVRDFGYKSADNMGRAVIQHQQGLDRVAAEYGYAPQRRQVNGAYVDFDPAETGGDLWVVRNRQAGSTLYMDDRIRRLAETDNPVYLATNARLSSGFGAYDNIRQVSIPGPLTDLGRPLAGADRALASILNIANTAVSSADRAGSFVPSETSDGSGLWGIGSRNPVQNQFGGKFR